VSAQRFTIERSGAVAAPAADVSAEQAVLSALLLNAAPPAGLEPAMFSDVRHRAIYRAAVALHGRGGAVDPVTLRAELDQAGHLDQAGGLEYLAELIDAVPTPDHVGHHAAIVRQHAARRELVGFLEVVASAQPLNGTLEAAAERIPFLVRSLRERFSAQSFSPPTLADFITENPGTVDWVIEGLAARDAVTMIAGHAKTGKTTICAELAGANAMGANFLGKPTQGGSVLWIDLEQPRGLTASVLGAHCLPSAPVHVQWGTLPDLDDAGAFCEQQHVNLVVVDSWTKARQGVLDANDEVEAAQAIAPWLDFARRYHVAVIFIHHLRKSEGSEGLDLRGSGVLAASVDIVCVFKRYDKVSDTDTRRSLEVFSRYGASKTVIERLDGRYRVCGTPGQVRRQTETARVVAVLTEEPRTAEEVATASGELATSAARTVLKQLAEGGLAQRTGTGKRGDAFRYAKAGSKDCAQINTLGLRAINEESA
jgi:replicative DNA helicase